MAMVSHPPVVSAATWRIASAKGDIVQFEDAMLLIAKTDLVPDGNRPGWFGLASGVSRFFSAGNRPNVRYALGKSVYKDDQYIGYITEISSNGREIKLAGPGVQQIQQRFTARILEVGEGDRVVVPLNAIQ